MPALGIEIFSYATSDSRNFSERLFEVICLAPEAEVVGVGAVGGAFIVGADQFGASAPYKVLAEVYGLTVANVVAKAKDLLNA